MSTLEIKVGESWKWDAEYLRLLQSGDFCDDLYAIQDFIEITADGLLLTAKLSEDFFLYILSDLATGLLQLSSGQRQKCIVQFYEHPYELVVTRDGAEALLSFYSLSGSREVVARDHPVPFVSLLMQVATNIDRLHQELLRINPRLKDDPFMERLAQSAKRLRRAAADALSSPKAPRSLPAGPGQTAPKKAARRGTPDEAQSAPTTQASKQAPAFKRRLGPSWSAPAKGPFRVSFWLNAQDAPLRSYRAETPADLHSLLFVGQVGLRGAGLRYDTQTGYPFLILEDLVSAAQSLVSALERGETRPHAVVEVFGEKLFVTLDRGVITLTLPSSQNDSSSRAQIPLKDFVEAIGEGALALTDCVIRLAPLQQENEKLKDLALEAEDLSASLADLYLSDLENDDPGPYRTAARRARPPAPSPQDLSLGEVRRLAFATRFSLELEFGSLLAVSQHALIVSSEDKLFGLDRQRGRVAWELAGQGKNAFTDETGEIILTSARDAILRRINPQNGRPLWEARLGGRDPSLEGPPLSFHRKGRGHLLIPTADRRLLCLSAATGRTLFTAPAPRRGAAHFAYRGKLLYGAGEDGTLFALDADDGHLVFRKRHRLRFFTRPLLVGDLALCAASSAGDARLLALDAYRGAILWERGVGVSLDAAPVIAQDTLVVIARSEEGLRLLRLDPRQGEVVWVRELSQGPERAASPVVIDDRVFVIDDDGILHICALSDGKEISTLDLGIETTKTSYLPPTPVYKGGLLFVAADTVHVIQPRTGQILGRIIECPGPPERLFLDPNVEVIVAADDDFIVSYRLSTHLSVVP